MEKIQSHKFKGSPRRCSFRCTIASRRVRVNRVYSRMWSRVHPAWPRSISDRSSGRHVSCPRRVACSGRCAWSSQGRNPPRAQARQHLLRTERRQGPKGCCARSVPTDGVAGAGCAWACCRPCRLHGICVIGLARIGTILVVERFWPAGAGAKVVPLPLLGSSFRQRTCQRFRCASAIRLRSTAVSFLCCDPADLPEAAGASCRAFPASALTTFSL